MVIYLTVIYSCLNLNIEWGISVELVHFQTLTNSFNRHLQVKYSYHIFVPMCRGQIWTLRLRNGQTDKLHERTTSINVPAIIAR